MTATSNEKLRETLVSRTTSALSPLTSFSGFDSAEEPLHDCPSASNLEKAQEVLLELMLPGRGRDIRVDASSLSAAIESECRAAWDLLLPEISRAVPFRWLGQAARTEGTGTVVDAAEEAQRVVAEFFERLPEVRRLLLSDIRAAYDGDPAATTYAEVKLAYPGLRAIASHRLAHELYRLNVPIVPRIMSELTHTATGADIHPGAKIGEAFFIDHATGVVIGETAELGSNVKLYQSVTLGAKSFPLDADGRPIKHIKRHPTVEDHVVIYSNATILGGDTVIGAHSTIGGNVFLMESVPPYSYVVKPSAFDVRPKKKKEL